jgi:hypothetical protein
MMEKKTDIPDPEDVSISTVTSDDPSESQKTYRVVTEKGVRLLVRLFNKSIGIVNNRIDINDKDITEIKFTTSMALAKVATYKGEMRRFMSKTIYPLYLIIACLIGVIVYDVLLDRLDIYPQTWQNVVPVVVMAILLSIVVIYLVIQVRKLSMSAANSVVTQELVDSQKLMDEVAASLRSDNKFKQNDLLLRAITKHILEGGDTRELREILSRIDNNPDSK